MKRTRRIEEIKKDKNVKTNDNGSFMEDGRKSLQRATSIFSGFFGSIWRELLRRLQGSNGGWKSNFFTGKWQQFVEAVEKL
ncbi:hypothetical protein V6N13_034414 [Hibiscus sabdariffa]